MIIIQFTQFPRTSDVLHHNGRANHCTPAIQTTSRYFNLSPGFPGEQVHTKPRAPMLNAPPPPPPPKTLTLLFT